jgi:D-beta-D-heptose 7-phosphate kinase / D-beta-D-heptose 1-phosphate adenosyltransferase
MIDNYLWGSCERISPEAPLQLVEGKSKTKTIEKISQG